MTALELQENLMLAIEMIADAEEIDIAAARVDREGVLGLVLVVREDGRESHFQVTISEEG